MQVFVLVYPGDWPDQGDNTVVHGVYGTRHQAERDARKLAELDADDMEFDSEEEKAEHIDETEAAFTIEEFVVQNFASFEDVHA